MPMKIEVEVDRVHPNPKNRNIYPPEEISRLAVNIGAYTLINPPSVRPLGGDQFQIIAGEKRWRAVKQLGWDKISVFLFDEYDELTTDGMRLAENLIRTFDFLSECQEFANLHSQGQSRVSLTQAFGFSEAELLYRVAIGYLPGEIANSLRQGIPLYRGEPSSWNKDAIRQLLPLRLLKGEGGILLPQKRGGVPHFSLYEYGEVRTAVELFNSRQRDFSELKAYVAERRLALEEQYREQLLKRELDVRASAAKAELEDDLARVREEADRQKQTEVAQLTKRLEDVLAEARLARQDKADLVAKHTQEINALQEKLTKAHQLELRQKEEAFKKHLDVLQRQLKDLRDQREKAVAEAREDIQKGFERERKKLIGRAEEEQTEAKKFKELLASLQTQFDRQLADREVAIHGQYHDELAKAEEAVAHHLAGQARLEAETRSLQEQLKSQSLALAGIRSEQEGALARKEREIGVRDVEVQRLLVEIARTKEKASADARAMAEAEAQRLAGEYRAKLDKGYAERLAAVEESFRRKEEKLHLKTEKTVDDAVSHFMKVCVEFDASIRYLVHDLLVHMREDQINDVLVRAEWLHRKLEEVAAAFRAKTSVAANAVETSFEVLQKREG